MDTFPTLGILGFGIMGQAICAGLLEAAGRPAESLRVATRGRRGREAALARGLEVRSIAEVVAQSDLLVLCVKPGDLDALLLEVVRQAAGRPLPPLVSIAAGKRTASLEELLPEGTAVVRAMPNTPCAIRCGMTVLCAGSHATPAHLAEARTLFEPLGRVLELPERHMDTVTGLSGSGPAFIYVVLEALAEGGVMRGLPRAVALELAAQMTLGAAEMVLRTGRHPASLKDDVTTPAGCTIAGLLALEDGRIRSVLARGVETAAKVAGELGK